MKRHALLIFAVVFAVALGGWILMGRPSGSPIASLDTADTNAGQELYQENCASCHGGELQGQPNWQSQNADGQPPRSRS